MDSIRVVLRRNGPVDDIERQQPPAPTASTVASSTSSNSPRPQQEMEERSPGSRFFARFSGFSRPPIPSFLSRRSSLGPRQQAPGDASHYPPRPSSSHYSDEPLETPKSPDFSLNMPHLPSTRLHLPNLARTWSQGSNGPPSRPGTRQTEQRRGNMPPMAASRPGSSGSMIRGPMFPDMTEPEPVVYATHVHGRSRAGSGGSGLSSADPAEQHLADLAGVGRERRRRRHRRHGSREGETDEERRRRREARHRRRRRRQEQEQKPTPKHFLFCFPWIRSKRIRSQILKCFVSGTFLVLLLAVYLSLSLTKNINSNEFTILLILIILFATIFFCHGLIRLCMFLVKPPRDQERRQERAREQQAAMSQLYNPGGYAIPNEPIRVVLARDEEAAGIESEATKLQPPAYGVVEARPRSIAPTAAMDVPLPPHPSESGRLAAPPRW